MSVLPIHYDCDPGQDDAIALLYALGSSAIDIKSVSVVGGNVDVRQCAKNALQILELAGFSDIPVYIGAEKPLKRPLYTLPDVFGETGMAGAEDLPAPLARPSPVNAVDALVGGVDASTLVATAPLTNIALALDSSPELAVRIKQLVIMGGCVYPDPFNGLFGNFAVSGTDGLAEYNIAIDPEAAKFVFRSGIENIILIGLNVTRSVLYNSEIDSLIRQCGSICALRAADILASVGKEDIEDYKALRKTPYDPVRAMHDILAMAYCENPDMFEFEIVPVKIVTEAVPAIAGQTLIAEDDFDCANVRVAISIDKAAFIETLVNNLGKLR